MTLIDSGREIYDEDGDGIQDNFHISHDELDKYYEPRVFGVVEDLENTLDGNLPGFPEKSFDLRLTEPKGLYTVSPLDDPRKPKKEEGAEE